MSERKVLNKYYPPDFDPTKIPRRSGPRKTQHKVRLMAPFSMTCKSCHEYISKGVKFNARKESAHEDYLGILIFRFYIRCTRCGAEITFKTDPANTDYTCEHGALRHFDMRLDQRKLDEQERKRLAEEENNPMKTLENRTEESKREIDIMDALDEIRTLNARNELVNTDAVIQNIMHLRRREHEEKILANGLTAEDEQLARSLFQHSSSAEQPSSGMTTFVPASSSESTTTTAPIIKRLRDDIDENEEAQNRSSLLADLVTLAPTMTSKKKNKFVASSTTISKTTTTCGAALPAEAAAAPSVSNGLGLVAYTSDDDDDE